MNGVVVQLLSRNGCNGSAAATGDPSVSSNMEKDVGEQPAENSLTSRTFEKIYH
jgi:hypothetical protein